MCGTPNTVAKKYCNLVLQLSFKNGKNKPPSRFERLIADRVGISVIVLVIAVLACGVLAYLAFTQQFSVLLGTLSGALVIGGSTMQFLRSLRSKILFKNSSPSVSVTKGPKVLLWILDGCSVQAFLDVVKRNRDLGTFYEQGYFAECVTIFPSITPAAHSAIMTGCYPSKTRIPAFDWVEVKTGYSGAGSREYIRCMPDFKRFQEETSKESQRTRQQEFFKGLGDALELNQRFLSPLVYTIFEILGEDWHTISIKEWIHRGADSFIGESMNAVLQDMLSKKIIGQNTMTELLFALYKEVSYEFGDVVWGSERKLADLMVYWKTGTDTKSHEFGPNSSQVREEVSEAIEKLGETLRFYKMNTNQPIYIIIAADHSQSEVREFSPLIEQFKKEIGCTVATREDRAYPERLNKADIIVANNDRAAFFYSFGKPETRQRVVDYLKNRREVDLIIYVEDDQARVIQVLENSFMGPEDIHVFFRDRQKEYPNAVERIEGLTKGNKWGDVVVSMKEGYSLNPDFKPEKEGEKILHGDHGGLNSSDSVTPLLVWGPTIKANKKNDAPNTFRTVDIAPTIAKIFKIEKTPTDGSVLEVFSENDN